MDIRLGDIVIMKKKHPCGSLQWRITRTGADIKMRCLGCDREVMLARGDAEKRIKSIQRDSE